MSLLTRASHLRNRWANFEPAADLIGNLDVTPSKITDNITDQRIFGTEIISAECGDDFIAVTKSLPLIDTIYRVTKDVLDVLISDEDTSVNRRFGNYSETVVTVPTKYQETWLSYRNTNVAKAFCYMDIPKLRLLSRASSQRRKYSDTLSGKVHDLARQINWIDDRSRCYVSLQVASFLQDSVLSSLTDVRPYYFPDDLGGGGKIPPFNTVSNYKRYHTKYKNGTYLRMYSEIIDSVLEFSKSIKLGNIPKVNQLLIDAANFENKFTDWIKGKGSFISLDREALQNRFLGDLICEVNPFGPERLLANRLIQTGEAVTEAAMVVAIRHNEVTSLLCSSTNYVDMLNLLENDRKDWKKCRMQIYDRHKNSWTEEAYFGFSYKEMRSDYVSEFLSFAGESGVNLKRMVRKELIFKRGALDSIYLNGPMRVKGLSMQPFSPYEGACNRISAPITDIMDTEDINMVSEIMTWFDEGQNIENVPMRYANDDEFIVEKAKSLDPRDGNGVAIVTHDKKLCKEVSKQTGRTVIMVPPIVSMTCMYTGLELEDALPPEYKWHIFEDSGAVQSVEEHHFVDGLVYRSRRFDVSKDLFDRPLGDPADIVREGEAEDLFSGNLGPVDWPKHKKYYFFPNSRWGYKPRYSKEYRYR